MGRVATARQLWYLTVAVIAVVNWVGTVGATPGNFEVLHSDATRLRFALKDLVPGWTTHNLRDGQLVLHEVSMSGFVNLGEPTRPALPRMGGWMVIPPGTSPRVITVEEKWAPADLRRLLIAATPVLRRNPETGEAFPADEILLPGERPSSGGTIPPDIADSIQKSDELGVPDITLTLGEIVPWRGRRIASFTITGVQTDGAGRARGTLESGIWEIQFVPDPLAGREDKVRGALPKRTPKGDGRFGFLFLNSELLESLPTEAAAGFVPDPVKPSGQDLEPFRTGAKRQATLLAPEVRLRVKRKRLYRVAASELQTRGLLPATGIQEDQIRLYQRRYQDELAIPDLPYQEVEVPIQMVGEGDDFSGDDFFIFYGLPPRDDLQWIAGTDTIPGAGDPDQTYNESNIYWLAAAEPQTDPWARMPLVTLDAAGQPLATSYRRVDSEETDNYYRETVEEVTNDRNHWNSNFATEVDATGNIYSADPAAVDGEVRVGIRGVANVYSENRWLDVTLETDQENIYLGAVNVNRLAERQVTATLSGAQLQDSSVNVHIEPQGTFPFVRAFLDWIEFSYDALYHTNSDHLVFHGSDEIDTRNIEVTGFTSNTVGLVEITEPHQPVLVSLTGANVVDAGNGTWTLSIQVPQTTGRRTFLAQTDLTSDGVSEILYYLADTAPMDNDPRTVASSPDLVVVTHPEFRGAIDRWITHRQQRMPGLTVHVVEIQQLLDWYNGGLKDPAAIKHFMNFALAQWGTWALQIVGDANENVRGLGIASSSQRYYNDPTDWVPTHMHVQDLGTSYQPELLMSDKWFVTAYTGDYPDDASSPAQMYVGRFGCNTVGELNTMIDKVEAYEPSQSNSAWRQRGIFLADDAWSFGSFYTGDVDQTLIHQAHEEEFKTSEDSMAVWWERAGLQAVRMFLDDYLDPYDPGTGERDTEEFRNITHAVFWPVLISELNEGASIVHYQGHANAKVLAHEFIMQDEPRGDRRDVDAMNNPGRPWVFFGMGCHVADWGQNTVKGTSIIEPSLGEKFLLRSQGGAVITYASSGYEFLTDNRDFSQLTITRWLSDPPAQAVGGQGVRSRWMIGELMWASEADLLASSPFSVRYRRVVNQYTLLGDALLMLDCEPPAVSTVLTDAGDQEVNDQDMLQALDASNLRTLRLDTQDVAGIDRLVILDSNQADLSAAATEVLPPGATNHQDVSYQVNLPVRPFDHSVTFHVFDTANNQASDNHFNLTVLLPQSADFTYDNGDPVELGAIPLPLDTPVNLRAAVQSAADLSGYAPAQMELTSTNLQLSNVQIDPRPGESHFLDLAFTVMDTTGSEEAKSVVLGIDGYDTEYVLQDGPTQQVDASITQLYAYPSPMQNQTRFVFQTSTVAPGRILIFSVTGRQVVDVSFGTGDYSPGVGAVVPWDGRDEMGDELANGVYLYRVIMDGPDGQITSDMQRIVVMR